MIKAIAQIIICAIAFYQQAIAQIIVANKDLEGIPCIAYGGGSVDSMDTSSYCSISSFYLCEGYVGLYSSGLDNDDIYPDFPKQGNTYVSLLGFHKTTWWGSISVQLSCYIRVGVKYSMTLWAANQFYEGGKVAKKTLVIWGNADSCSRIEKLWESGQIDTGWHQYAAILTPKLQDYEYIHFRIGLSDSNSYFLSLDALSDIYPFNANDVTATIQDTAFAKANSTCIELSATANITTYDTVYWQDAAGNKIADGFNGGTVCPDSSTYYVIAMRDSVQDCAGIWWSYDTVKVTVNTGTAVATPAGSEAYGVNIFPNPATNSINIESGANLMRQISIFDATGKNIYSQQIKATTYTTILLENRINTSGVYFAEVTFTNGLKQRVKFLKQ